MKNYCFIFVDFDLMCSYVKFKEEFSISNLIEYNFIVKNSICPITAKQTLEAFIDEHYNDFKIVLNTLGIEQTEILYKKLNRNYIEIGYIDYLDDLTIEKTLQKLALTIDETNETTRKRLQKDLQGIGNINFSSLPPLIKTLVLASNYSIGMWGNL